jgi:predicted nucleic acid-binding protein
VIVLDTNVVSEAMRPSPNRAVVTWLDEQETSTLFLTTVTVAEVHYGLCVLSEGKRRRSLEDGFARILTGAFEGRILSFDEPAAREYGKVMSQCRERGRPLGILDGQIAAIARAAGFGVATRNTRDFADCGLTLVNPFA